MSYQSVQSVDGLVLKNNNYLKLNNITKYDGTIIMTQQEKQQFPQHAAEAITVNLIRSLQDNATSLIRF